jgi:toxin ParE1/3/4
MKRRALPVERTNQFKRDCAEIWHYIALDNPAAATRLIQLFDQKIATLSEFPRIGASREEVRSGVRSLPVRNYVLYYRAGESKLTLLRVLHGARNVQKAFDE